MKGLYSFCLIAGIFLYSAVAQGTNPTVTADAEAQRRREREQAERAERIRKAQEFDRLKNVGGPRGSSVKTNGNVNLADIEKSIEEQKKLLRPNPEDVTKYAGFLKSPRTGLVKLSSNFDCAEKNIVRADGPCANFIPLGSFFSFRTMDYSNKILADIAINNNKFVIADYFANGMIVSLGDVPLETVSLQSDGMGFLTAYRPARENKEIAVRNEDLARSVESGNYRYANTADVNNNTTYAVRVIAYRGEINREIAPGLTFNILKGDKRVDTIVVFRVVRQDGDGTITIVSKELQRQDSPKFKLSKEEMGKYLR